MQDQFKFEEIKRFNEIASILEVGFEQAVDLFKLVSYRPVEKIEEHFDFDENAKDTIYFCDLWIKEVLNKNTKTTMALEEAIHYTIKNEWSEFAESIFNYDEISVLLNDESLKLILKITTEGVE